MNKISSALLQIGLNEDILNQFAFTSNFKKRIRKLSGFDYLLILLANASKEIMSYNTMACSLAEDPLKCVHKQALHKAMNNESFLRFIDKAFNFILESKINLTENKFSSIFNRILLHDSTIVKLPQKLFNTYSGIKNQFTQVTNSRIQLVFDILNNVFIALSIDSYSINDALGGKLLTPKENDLILRDRGYFTLKEVCRIIDALAFFIYRYHPSFNYYDVQTGKVLNLLKILTKKKCLDMNVKLNGINGPILRLLAKPIDENLARERRLQMKKDKRNNPSKSMLALLSWSIYLTNIEDETVTYKDIFELYKLRWRIEIIFKTLKSNLKLDNIHTVSDTQYKFMVKAKMMLLLLTIKFVYEPLVSVIKNLYNKELSFLKVVRCINDNLSMLPDLIKTVKLNNITRCNELDAIAKYCCYDKRKRTNYEKLLLVSLS